MNLATQSLATCGKCGAKVSPEHMNHHETSGICAKIAIWKAGSQPQEDSSKSGARRSGRALAVPVEPVARLNPSGFDPSRKNNECPYELTDARTPVWHEGYRAALRWMMEATR